MSEFPAALKRGLTVRHIRFMALGSAIGTGLFYGSVSAIQTAGPAVLFAYIVGGAVVFLVMRALGEMAVLHPVSGSFGQYAGRYLGPLAGFITGWTFVFEMAIVALADVTAFGIYMQFWFPDTPQWIWVLAIVLLVAGAVGLELGMRGAIKDNLRQEISATLGSTPEVELGPQPVLLSYVTGTLGTIRITTDGAPAEGATGPVPAIDITAEGVRSEGATSRIDSLTGTAFVSDETMTAAAQSGGAGGVGDSLLGGLIQVQDIVSDPAAGTLRVSISGLAEAVVTPRLIDGNLEMDPQQASVLGFQLPSEILGGTVSMMDSALADLPEGIELTGVRVVDGGMTVDLAGRDVVLESTR